MRRRFPVRQQFALRRSIFRRLHDRLRQPGLQSGPASQCRLGFSRLGCFLHSRGHRLQFRERVNFRGCGCIQRLLNVTFLFRIELCSRRGTRRCQEFPRPESFLWRLGYRGWHRGRHGGRHRYRYRNRAAAAAAARPVLDVSGGAAGSGTAGAVGGCAAGFGAPGCNFDRSNSHAVLMVSRTCSGRIGFTRTEFAPACKRLGQLGIIADDRQNQRAGARPSNPAPFSAGTPLRVDPPSP